MPKTDISLDLPRLCSAAKKARMALRFYREERRDAVRLYLGNHYSDETARVPQPVNLLDLYVTVIVKNLVAKEPRVMYSTHNRPDKPAVRAMQDWVNPHLRRMNFAHSMRRCVHDALFSVGIAKVALADPGEAAVSGWQLTAGDVCVWPVDLDDFVFDVHARSFDEAGYVAHRRRVPLEVVKSFKHYSKARLKLEPTDHRAFNAEGDERIDVLGRGYTAGYEEFEDYIDLWEFWLPRHREIVTLVADDSGNPELCADEEPLRVQKWVGHPQGPYRFLGFKHVPGNAMPKGPVQDLVELHKAANNVYRKCIEQARDSKKVYAVPGGRTEQGSRVVNANDREMIACDSAPVVMDFMGADPNNLQFGVHLADVFDKHGGNLSTLGGLAVQAKTAHQEGLLNQNAGSGVADMQAATVTFTTEVVEACSWYWWNHPSLVMRSTVQAPGAPWIEETRELHPFGARDQAGRPRPLRRQAPWESLDIRIDPYSLQHQSPQGRAADLTAVMTQVIAPMLGLLQQQGIGVDLNKFLLLLGELKDMPDLADITTVVETPSEGMSGASGGAAQDGARMPQNTTREYVRRSVGANSPQDRAGQLANTLRQGAAQPNGQPR